MFAYLSPYEARQTPIYASLVAEFLDGPDHTRPTAPARYCRQAGCGRSASNHLWDAETCPVPEGMPHG